MTLRSSRGSIIPMFVMAIRLTNRSLLGHLTPVRHRFETRFPSTKSQPNRSGTQRDIRRLTFRQALRIAEVTREME